MVYLALDSYQGHFYSYKTRYNGCNIAGIKTQEGGSTGSGVIGTPAIYVKLAASTSGAFSVTYNDGEVTLEKVTSADIPEGDWQSTDYGYFSTRPIATSANITTSGDLTANKISGNAIRYSATEPTTNLAEGQIWLKPI